MLGVTKLDIAAKVEVGLTAVGVELIVSEVELTSVGVELKTAVSDRLLVMAVVLDIELITT